MSASALVLPPGVKEVKWGFHCKTCEVRSKFWLHDTKKVLEELVRHSKVNQEMNANTGGFLLIHCDHIGRAPAFFLLRHDGEHQIDVISDDVEANVKIDEEDMGDQEEPVGSA